jgi:hypothetical protein
MGWKVEVWRVYDRIAGRLRSNVRQMWDGRRWVNGVKKGRLAIVSSPRFDRYVHSIGSLRSSPQVAAAARERRVEL